MADPVDEFRRNSLTLPDLVEELFLSRECFNLYRKEEFEHQLFKYSVIDQESRVIIDSTSKLNTSIIFTRKNKRLQLIKDIISKSYGFQMRNI